MCVRCVGRKSVPKSHTKSLHTTDTDNSVHKHTRRYIKRESDIESPWEWILNTSDRISWFSIQRQTWVTKAEKNIHTPTIERERKRMRKLSSKLFPFSWNEMLRLKMRCSEYFPSKVRIKLMQCLVSVRMCMWVFFPFLFGSVRRFFIEFNPNTLTMIYVSREDIKYTKIYRFSQFDYHKYHNENWCDQMNMDSFVCVLRCFFLLLNAPTHRCCHSWLNWERKMEQFISIAIDFISSQTENGIATAPLHDVWIWHCQKKENVDFSFHSLSFSWSN